MYTAVTDDQIIIIIDGKCKTVSRGSAISAKVLAEISKPHPDEAVIAKLIDVKLSFAEYTGSDMEIGYDGSVTRNGDRLPPVLAKKVIDCFHDGVDYAYLLNFFDNLSANPSYRAITELYGFLEHGGMPITPDGCFLAYKGLRDDFWSITGGSTSKVLKGKVDEAGRIFNGVGEEIEVERNYVSDDARVACGQGLHAGSEEYATGFAQGRVVIVKVNPRDVVSIPQDSSKQKMRVCAYTVVAEHVGTLNDSGVSDALNPYSSSPKLEDSFDFDRDYGQGVEDEDEDEYEDEYEDVEEAADEDDNDGELEVRCTIKTSGCAADRESSGRDSRSSRGVASAFLAVLDALNCGK